MSLEKEGYTQIATLWEKDNKFGVSVTPTKNKTIDADKMIRCLQTIKDHFEAQFNHTSFYINQKAICWSPPTSVH